MHSEKSRTFDGNMSLNYHVKCFLKVKYVPDYRVIKDLWRMRWEDQLEVRKQVIAQHKKFYEDNQKKIPKSLLKKRKRDSIEKEEQTPPKKKQKTKHEEDEKKEEKEEFYSKLTVPKLRKELRKRRLETKGRKRELIERLMEDDNKSEGEEEELDDEESENVEMDDDNENNDGDDLPTQLEYSEEGIILNKIDNPIELKDEVDKLWEIYDALEVQTENKDLLLLLKENQMSTEGSQEQLRIRCSFGMLFGRTAKCPQCKTGELHWKGNKYKCVGGNISEWAKCEHSLSTDEVSLEEFIIPKKLKKISFFKDFQFEQKRPVKRVVFPFDSRHRICSFKAQLTKLEIDAKRGKLLFSLVFCILGKCSKSKKAMLELINEYGGYCMSSLNPSKVTHIICKKNSGYDRNANYKIAKENELPIYDESWLFDAIKNKEIPANPTKYLLEGKINPEESKLTCGTVN